VNLCESDKQLFIVYHIKVVVKNKSYVYNIFTTLSKQILSSILLLVVIDGLKNNLSDGLKLEPVTIYYI